MGLLFGLSQVWTKLSSFFTNFFIRWFAEGKGTEKYTNRLAKNVEKTCIHISGKIWFQDNYLNIFFQGFWQKIDTYDEQPDIHFEHEMVIQLETENPDKTISWSTMKNYNALLEDKIRMPSIQVLYSNVVF